MKIYNTEVWGFKHALRSMRNPMDSWDKADSLGCLECELDCDECPLNDIDNCFEYDVVIGENDMKLAQNLVKAGNEHGKYLRMIHVAADFEMPRYWWAEADCYKFGTKNSCSTMHTIMKKEITIDNFEVNEKVKEILRKEDKTKKKYTYKCELPEDVELNSKIFEINNYSYEIFNNGEIYSLPKDVTDSIGRTRHYPRRKMSINQNAGEYYSVRLGGRNGGENICVHRLLAELFIPNPNNYEEVNHIDGDKGNCSLDNLEWCTHQENCQHAHDIGLNNATPYAKYKAYITNRKVTLSDIREMKKLYESGMLQKDIAEKFKLKQAQVSSLLKDDICEYADDYEEAYIYEKVINRLNELRQMYLDTKDYNYVIRMKRILPESFLQMRTWDTNYAELRNIYFQRRHHRLHEEWVDVFCKWVESLPYAKELILYTGEKENE